jgi:pyruvate/2-oxoglutarate/acetoin dehydrogenase E1 component
LRAPVRRVTVPDVAIPYAPHLETAVLPDEHSVVRAVREVMGAGR